MHVDLTTQKVMFAADNQAQIASARSLEKEQEDVRAILAVICVRTVHKPIHHVNRPSTTERRRVRRVRRNTLTWTSGVTELPYYLSKEGLKRDLCEERPSWILSAYAPGKDAPEQLFGGYLREQSPEEIRLYLLKGHEGGYPQEALQNIEALNSNAERQMQNTLGNLDGALNYIIEAGTKHPNRLDVCAETLQDFGRPRLAFKDIQQVADPWRKAQSALGQPLPFGAQPSSFGQAAADRPNPAFGQASVLQSKPAVGTPPFGQAARSAFGQSTFSHHPQLSSALGQATTPNQFGADCGNQKPPPNPFGQQHQTQSPSSFGQAQSANLSPFGKPAVANPFGQVQQQKQLSPFGGAVNGSPIAQPTSANNPLTFGASATTFGFGIAAEAAAAPGPAPAYVSQGRGGQNPYGPNATRQHPPAASYIVKDPRTRRLLTFKGQPVSYEDKNGRLGPPMMQAAGFGGNGTIKTKIWNPDGAPVFAPNTEADPPALYDDEQVKAAWRPFLETGRFKDGVMPEIPPKREWCVWDF